MNLKKRISALLLASVLIVGVFSGCKSQEGEGEKPATKPSEKPAVVTSDETIKTITPSFTSEVKEKEELNEDTIGWLQVPYTTISDVVVQSKENNQVYLRMNFDKDYEFSGVYYADYRSEMGDGSREQLPVNLTIYGHALTDDKEHKKYNVKFGPLHDYRDPEYASEHPYIYFSTDKEDFVYEIISVFLANSDNPDNPYNKGDAEKGTFHEVVRNEIIPRSLYDYGVEISDDDKFLTLSTCIYVLEDGTPTYYPDTYYRYAIMARLCDPDEPVKEDLKLEVNEDRIIDPDGKWSK